MDNASSGELTTVEVIESSVRSENSWNNWSEIAGRVLVESYIQLIFNIIIYIIILILKFWKEIKRKKLIAMPANLEIWNMPNELWWALVAGNLAMSSHFWQYNRP